MFRRPIAEEISLPTKCVLFVCLGVCGSLFSILPPLQDSAFLESFEAVAPLSSLNFFDVKIIQMSAVTFDSNSGEFGL